jgi:hypothetical protein
MDVQVRIFFTEMMSPGTELFLQLYESDCTVDKSKGFVNILDFDIFEEAGDDRTVIYNLHVMQEGEHLLELFSDCAGEYLLIVE